MTVRSTPSDRCVPSPASWIFLTTASTRSRGACGSMTTIIVSPPPKMPMGPARLRSSCQFPLARHATVNLHAKNKTPLTPHRGERCLTAPAVPPSFRPARAQADAHHGTASNAIPSPLVTVECRRSLLGCRSVRASRVHSLVSARPLSHHSRLSPRRGDGYSLGHRQYEIE